MKRDEFNELKIVNGDNDPSFEFGGPSQRREFTSYKENDDSFRDELNDVDVSNSGKRPKRERRQRRRQSSKDDTTSKDSGSSTGGVSGGTSGGAGGAGGASGAGAAGTATTVATVVGSSLIAVATLSTLVGINLFFNGKCVINNLEPTTNSIVYELNLTDINDDECVIQLEYQSYNEVQPLEEGFNSGEFIDLIPNTKYRLSVIDITYDEYVIHEEYVSTLEEAVTTTFTVYFDTDGGTEIEPQEVPLNGHATQPEDPVKEGYEFVGWFADNDFTKEYIFEEFVTEDITIYAKWESLVETHTVTFDTDGGSEIEPQQVAHNEHATQPDDPTKVGCTFAGWFANNDYTEEYIFEEFVTEDVTIYAKWDVLQLTISFEANNGTSETMEPVVVDYGTRYSLPENPFSDPDLHQMFRGWQINGTYAGKSYEWAVKVDTVLTATWTDCDVITYHDSNEQDPTTYIVKVAKDSNIFDTLEESPFPVPDGQELRGWRLDDLTVGPGGYFTYTGDVTVYAIWGDANNYIVTFDPGTGMEGDVEQETIVAPKDSEITIPECNYTAPDYDHRFGYWRDGDTGDYYYAGDPYTLTKDMHLSAIWVEKDNPINVTYYADENHLEYFIDRTYSEDNPYILLSEAPASFTIPDGKQLVGWTDLAGAPYDLGQEIILQDSLTLTAMWEEIESISPTLQFHVDSFDEMQQQLYYSYSYSADDNPYSSFMLEMTFPYTDSPVSVELDIQDTDGSVTGGKYVQLEQDTSQLILETHSEIVTYNVCGVLATTLESETLDQGSFSPVALTCELDYVLLGGIDLEVNNASFPVCFIDDSHYLPVTLFMSDFGHSKHGTDFTLRYIAGGMEHADTFTYQGGTSYVPLSIGEISSSYSIDKLWITDSNGETIQGGNTDGIAENVSFVMSDLGTIYGFELSEESFYSRSGGKFRIVAMRGETGLTYADLGVTSATLTFEFQNRSGAPGNIKVEANLDFNTDTNIRSYIDFTIDDYDTFIEYLRCYPVNVSLSCSGNSASIDGYMYYVFRVM